MRILFVNPNTTEGFTVKIQDTIDHYASPSTIAIARNPVAGPSSIQCVYDELLSSAPTLELVIPLLDSFDGFVIACFSDHPVVYALREITNKPVLGIAEASVYFASMLGRKFSIVTTNEAWEPLLGDAVRHYGLDERCASVRSTRLPVLALEHSSPEETYQIILQTARTAVEQDDAEVICLGCAGMSGFDKRLESDLQIPVVDGVVAALKIMEGLTGYQLKTSKKRVYMYPSRTELKNLPSVFDLPYQDDPD
jgi:allantoin racemase